MAMSCAEERHSCRALLEGKVAGRCHLQRRDQLFFGGSCPDGDADKQDRQTLDCLVIERLCLCCGV